MFWCVVLLSIFTRLFCILMSLKGESKHKQVKYSGILHTKMPDKLFFIQLTFFFCLVFLLIIHKVRKAKWIERRSVCSQLVKQVFFTVKNNQQSKWPYNIAEYLYSICVLFALYFVRLVNKVLHFMNNFLSSKLLLSGGLPKVDIASRLYRFQWWTPPGWTPF